MALPSIFLRCSTSTTPQTRINMNKVLSVEKLDIVDANNASNTKYGLSFNMDTDNTAPKVFTLYYTTSGLRNASLAAIDAIVTTVTV